jgi:hypothetical protein
MASGLVSEVRHKVAQSAEPLFQARSSKSKWKAHPRLDEDRLCFAGLLRLSLAGTSERLRS